MNYHNITHEDMLNGDGIRVVLWVAGCNHHCPECQNPETWSVESGVPFDDEALNELFAELSKDYVSGITFSGGDPFLFHNSLSVFLLMEKIKKNFPDKTIWVYTGYTYEQIMSEQKRIVARNCLVRFVDVLVDGEYMKDLRDVNLKWRGSSNQRVIDVQKSLKERKVVLHCE